MEPRSSLTLSSLLLRICVGVASVNLVLLVLRNGRVPRWQTIVNALAWFLFGDCNYGNFPGFGGLRNLSLSGVGRRTIQQATGLDISDTDGISHYVCGSCRSRLLTFERECNKIEATKKSITLTYKKTLSCWRFKRGVIASPTSSCTVKKADLTASPPMAGDERLIVTFCI